MLYVQDDVNDANPCTAFGLRLQLLETADLASIRLGVVPAVRFLDIILTQPKNSVGALGCDYIRVVD